MTTHSANTTAIQKAAEILRSGGVVAFPTETVYGLGADAFNERAVAQIFEIKNRPYFDPLIVHVSQFSDVEGIASIPDTARILSSAFWPGPLTLVLKKKKGIPDLVVSGLNTVAVRMPAHPVALELIRTAKTPIAAPSANPFGYLSPTTAQHVEGQLGDRIEMILDGGPCRTGVESTIVDLSGDRPTLLRPGGIPPEEIEKLIGPLNRKVSSLHPSAPGQLAQHYSPRKPLRILSIEEMKEHSSLSHAGILFFKKPSQTFSWMVSETLSAGGDSKEAAANFFSALHRLDQSKAEIIFAEPIPESGLGLAMMDRLRKAAATYQ